MRYNIRTEFNGKYNVIREQDITCHGLTLEESMTVVKILNRDRPIDEYEGRFFFLCIGNDNYRRVNSIGQDIGAGRQYPDNYLSPLDLEKRIWIEVRNRPLKK